MEKTLPKIKNMNKKFKVGDIAIVSDKIHGHGFNIGDTVEVVTVENIDYCVSDGVADWWVQYEELIKTGMNVRNWN